MSYCSLKEAYGEDFYNQVNNLNPSRNHLNYSGSRFDPEISRNGQLKSMRKSANIQSKNDLITHKKSFSSVMGRRYEEPPRIENTKTFKPWGEIEDEKDYSEFSPKEYLKKSILRDRVYEKYEEPSGYGIVSKYKNVENDECDNFFKHIESCKGCQEKLKRRMVEYFKQKKNNLIMNEPFNNEIVENFSNQCNPIYLLLFGIFIIYILDNSKNI